MKIWGVILFILWFSFNSYSQNTPVLTHIPSSVGDSTGIALLIHFPDSARYDTCGAPIAILVAGGGGSTGIIYNYPAVISYFGFIQVFFNFPGGGINPIVSGGTYDLRGPNCINAFKDVIKFCSGEIADNDGKYLSELIPITPNYQNVGLVGGSNGGNISLAVAGIYGNQLPGLKWICNWETPVGDGIILADMGNTNFGGPLTTNLAYNDTTGAFDYSKLKYCDTLYFNYNANFDTLAGFYYDNDNNNSPNDVVDYKLEPLIYGTGVNTKANYSQKIIELGYSMGLIPNPKPFYIPTLQESKDFWKWRNGENWIDSISIKRPDMLFMVTSRDHDHYINSPDHPGVLNQYSKFLNTSLNIVRLNPDKTYLEYVLDSVYPGLPDNTCFTVYDHLSIRSVMVPDSVDQKLLYAAGACELADRSIRGDYRLQLDSVYDNCIPFIPEIIDTTNDTTSTGQLSVEIIKSKIYPNPAADFTTLSIYTGDAVNIYLQLTDVTGRIIYNEKLNSLKSESMDFLINTSELENGIYILMLQRNEKTEALKLEVLH